MEPLAIDVFTDIVCPWCFIGNERLEQVLSTESREVVVTHHPFLLDPTTPPEGFNVQEYLRKKYRADPLAMFAQVEAQAKSSGIPLDLTRQPMSYRTLKAHTLSRHAEAKGTQRTLVRDLFKSYFLDAANIGDDQVLATIAARHGFSEDEALGLVRDEAELAATRTETEEAAAMGIRGVPLFIFDRKRAISGAQPESVLRAAIQAA
jgi:predicted DsbA family dithiol-disulfide isomerase